VAGRAALADRHRALRARCVAGPLQAVERGGQAQPPDGTRPGVGSRGPGVPIHQKVSAAIDLVHPGIDRRQRERRAGLLRKRLERGHRDQRNVEREAQPLRDAAADAQAGEGAGSGVEGDRVEVSEAEPGLREQAARHHQREPGMSLAGALAEEGAAYLAAFPLPKRDRAPLRGSREREQAARFGARRAFLGRAGARILEWLGGHPGILVQ